jgi:FixJ family two-component response regulator
MQAEVAKSTLVAVVDDDESVRESLPELLGELGFAAEAFTSGAEFLGSDAVERVRCLILDIAMPGMSGPDLHRELRRMGVTVPVIFITAQNDPTVRAAMLANGAVACLFKPFSGTEVRLALAAAFRATP